MAELTEKQIKNRNATSMQQLIEELKASNNAIDDVFYCEYSGMWWIYYKFEGPLNAEYYTFTELLESLLKLDK